MLNRYYLLLEKKFFHWVVSKRISIGLYALSLLLIPLLYIIPYVNLYVNSQVIAFFILTIAVIVFRIRIEVLSVVLILVFIFCIPLVLIRSFDKAEFLINLVYGILFVSFISNVGILKGKKNE